MPDARCQTPDPRRRTPNSRRRTPNSRRQTRSRPYFLTTRGKRGLMKLFPNSVLVASIVSFLSGNRTASAVDGIGFPVDDGNRIGQFIVVHACLAIRGRPAQRQRDGAGADAGWIPV